MEKRNDDKTRLAVDTSYQLLFPFPLLIQISRITKYKATLKSISAITDDVVANICHRNVSITFARENTTKNFTLGK